MSIPLFDPSGWLWPFNVLGQGFLDLIDWLNASTHGVVNNFGAFLYGAIQDLGNSVSASFNWINTSTHGVVNGISSFLYGALIDLGNSVNASFTWLKDQSKTFINNSQAVLTTTITNTQTALDQGIRDTQVGINATILNTQTALDTGIKDVQKNVGASIELIPKAIWEFAKVTTGPFLKQLNDAMEAA